MAIFGNLADLPLPEVLMMIGNKSGCLLLWNLPSGKEYEFHVAESCIRGLLRNGETVADILLIRDLMLEVINCNSGEFEFQKRSIYDLKEDFHISIEHILLNTATVVDEINAYKEFFPHEKTLFKASGPLDVWLDGDLYNFWERSATLLAEGCSAEELAKILGFSLDKVQLNLYKLRSVGKIEPMRAMEKRFSRNHSAKPVFSESELKENLTAAKLPIDAEQLETLSEMVPLVTTTANHNSYHNHNHNLNHNHNNHNLNHNHNNHNNHSNSSNSSTQNVGLIRRMLNALTFGRLK